MRSRSEVLVAAALVALALLACSGPSLEVLSRPRAHFLSRQGDALTLDGKPFRFLSFNAYTLSGCRGGTEPTADQMDAFFAALRPDSIVRTFAFEPLGLVGVDEVVAAAKAHGQMVALVLTDHASSCGEGEVAKTSDFYAADFRTAYLPWVRKVVERYAGEPAVAFWEPVKGPVNIDAATLRTFYDVVGGEIRRLDANHLIEAGIHGPWAYGGPDGYRQIVESAGIDIASFHTYDDAAVPFPSLEDSIAVSAEVAKPLVVIETGLFASRGGDPASSNNGFSCISFDTRRDTLEAQLTSAFATRLSGVELWDWEPVSAPSCSHTIGPDDPTVDLVRSFPLP